jgi:putative redox protein
VRVPVTATWTKNSTFQVSFPGGETLILAGVPGAERPGPGPPPTETVQAAVAVCSGIDIVMILGKMRRTVTALRVEVEAVRRDQQPRIYTDLTLVYHVDGPDLDEASVRRAVRLSEEKYCSVSAMLRPTVRLGYRIILNGRGIDAGGD